MRPNLVVLAAVIALVSRCTAVSADSSTNLNQALDTLQNHAGDGNRFLRSANIVDDRVDDIDSDDDIDNDDEERGGKLGLRNLPNGMRAERPQTTSTKGSHSSLTYAKRTNMAKSDGSITTSTIASGPITWPS
ncbi:hypothetical protein DVH05_007384 [Phytophthora capsici]|nr:hypothetical protein DVH05_007384 [Phytophthora capsici]